MPMSSYRPFWRSRLVEVKSLWLRLPADATLAEAHSQFQTSPEFGANDWRCSSLGEYADHGWQSADFTAANNWPRRPCLRGFSLPPFRHCCRRSPKQHGQSIEATRVPFTPPLGAAQHTRDSSIYGRRLWSSFAGGENGCTGTARATWRTWLLRPQL